MSECETGVVGRPEIERAWYRARGFGLDPGMDVRESLVADINPRSRIVVAAEPVLDRMARELSGTRFTVLLADSDSTIVDRRVADRVPTRWLERAMAVPGSRYVESVTGTNALATAFELRRGIAVTGEEHYLEMLRQFCCYGAPIVHPVTRRLEGVLDVTGHVRDASVLLPPFLLRAVRDIELQLLEGSRLAERNILTAYQARGPRVSRPVLALNDQVVMANRFALDALRTEDHARLRGLAAEAPTAGSVAVPYELVSGRTVTLQYERIPDSAGGVIFDIVDDDRPPTPRTRRTRQSTISATDHVILVCGEPGTGRTTRATEIAGRDAVVLSAVDEGVDDTWFAAVAAAISAGLPVVIDDVDLLTGTGARTLAQWIDRAESLVVLTSIAPTAFEPAQRCVLARCQSRQALPPLRGRADFAEVAHDVLDRIPEGRGRRLTPSALHILQSHQWPGNLRELHEVLRIAANAMRVGDVTERDLPEAYRISPRRRRLGLLEQAEHDTIVAALAKSAGNKAQAAESLGIGRNTLYERIRKLGIPT